MKFLEGLGPDPYLLVCCNLPNRLNVYCKGGYAMNEVCRHYIIKPFAGKDGILRVPHEGHNFSGGEKAYCTHPDSLHLPGTPVGTLCGGNVSKCDIPREKR
jgi:hypothetical protein